MRSVELDNVSERSQVGWDIRFFDRLHEADAFCEVISVRLHFALLDTEHRQFETPLDVSIQSGAWDRFHFHDFAQREVRRFIKARKGSHK
jgi:hypothetical protein